MNRWGQFVFQAVVLAILIPWGWQITSAVNKLAADMQENHAWHTSHSEMVQREKENLRLQVMSDVDKMVRALIERSELKHERLSQDFRDTDKTVRETSAKIAVLADSFQSLATAFGKMQANVLTALSDLDFQRNKEKGQ